MRSRGGMEKFLLGSLNFSQKEGGLKYRYLLLNSMLLSASFISFAAGMIRIIAGNYLLAAVDISVFVLTFLLFFVARSSRNRFKIISNITLGIFFVFFSSLVVLLDQDIKLIWYANLLMAAYLLRGHKYGTKYYLITLTTLSLLYFLEPFGSHIKTIDYLLSIASYTAFAIFLGMSEIQHKKNIIFLKNSSAKISKAQKRLYEQNRVNPVTKLANKIVLQEDLDRCEDEMSLMLLEINQYDLLINKFGEKFMESIHKRVALILKAYSKRNINIYHISDDTYAIFIKKPTFNEDLSLASKIEKVFSNVKVENGDLKVVINFLIAIVREKKNALSYGKLTLRKIERSEAKRVEVYKHDPKLEEIQKNNLYWSKRLPELLKDDKIVPYFQAIFDNKTGKIVKYECLVRAIDDEKIVSPFFFLPATKSLGLLSELTKVMIKKSFQIFSGSSYDFSINITEEDLREEYLVDFLVQMCKTYDVEPKRVILEVLENINSQDSEYANEQFARLREHGFGLAIDDFGAEASNFSRLMTLKADIIKIDGQFIKNLDNDLDSHKIVEAIVSLAKKMGAKTVAEFVHSKEIYKIVKSLGIDYSQGFYLAEPKSCIDKEEELSSIEGDEEILATL